MPTMSGTTHSISGGASPKMLKVPSMRLVRTIVVMPNHRGHAL
jgi:hypothetical protein